MQERLSLLAIFCGLLSACAQSEPPHPQKIGMANPASVFCLEQGGSLTIKSTPQGSVGICTLPNGQEIEEWAYYRRHHANQS